MKCDFVALIDGIPRKDIFECKKCSNHYFLCNAPSGLVFASCDLHVKLNYEFWDKISLKEYLNLCDKKTLVAYVLES